MVILDRMAKDQDAVNQAILKRDEVTTPIREAAFANPLLTPEQMQKGITLVVDKQIEDVLKSPAGKRDSVISVMNDVKTDISRATNVNELYEILLGKLDDYTVLTNKITFILNNGYSSNDLINDLAKKIINDKTISDKNKSNIFLKMSYISSLLASGSGEYIQILYLCSHINNTLNCVEI
jgi:hypothetical protein